MLANEAGNQETGEGGAAGGDVLIVVSKLKGYIKNQSGMNTANNVAAVLSGIVRNHCDQAIERAKADGRKTVMDRDFG